MPTRNNVETPNVVLAPSPERGEQLVKLYASPRALRNIDEDLWEAKLGEYAGLVHGNIIEDDAGAEVAGGTNGLLETVALFQGLMRPLIKPEGDEKVLIYVTNPAATYTHKRFRPAFTRVTRPVNSVFVTYAELFRDGGVDRNKYQVPTEIDGIIYFWEWMPWDEHDRRLPEQYEGSNKRYLTRHW
jgi:hypothetical protein